MGKPWGTIGKRRGIYGPYPPKAEAARSNRAGSANLSKGLIEPTTERPNPLCAVCARYGVVASFAGAAP